MIVFLAFNLETETWTARCRQTLPGLHKADHGPAKVTHGIGWKAP
jgi:hypothetical protein